MLYHTYKHYGEYDRYLLNIRYLRTSTFPPENDDVKPLRYEKGDFVITGYLLSSVADPVLFLPLMPGYVFSVSRIPDQYF
jgi:hypothetical protein